MQGKLVKPPEQVEFAAALVAQFWTHCGMFWAETRTAAKGTMAAMRWRIATMAVDGQE